MSLAKLTSQQKSFVGSLFLLSGFCIALSLIRFEASGTTQYWFLAWNLLLAWIPVLFAWILFVKNPKGLLWSWQNFALAAGWLIFLPNAYYLLTDFIHLGSGAGVDIVFDIALFSSYAFTGLILGFVALYMVHIRALQRFGARAHLLPAVALLLSGFAIYLGRILRWNSWDVIINPFGLLFDVSSSVINPTQHTLTFTTTLLFSSLLGLMYFVVWNTIQLVAASSRHR